MESAGTAPGLMRNRSSTPFAMQRGRRVEEHQARLTPSRKGRITLGGRMEGVVERGAILGAKWRLLAEASTTLARSLDYKETLTNVVRLVVPKMADYAG